MNPFKRKLRVEGTEMQENTAFGGIWRVFIVGSEERKIGEGWSDDYG